MRVRQIFAIGVLYSHCRVLFVVYDNDNEFCVSANRAYSQRLPGQGNSASGNPLCLIQPLVTPYV